MGERAVTRVERVLDRLGIAVDRKHGQRIWALCPFHKDHHADNWFIRFSGPRRGQHHCFACKRGGSLLDLVEHVRRCSRDRAREWLKNFDDDAPPPPARRVRMEVRSPVSLGFETPREFIGGPLDEWVSGAREYALSRGITRAQVDRWRIGYAVEGMMAGRIIFLARDARGVPANYSARTFVDHDKRYLTPPLSDRPDLDVMFGEEHWPAPGPDGRRPGFVALVEGAINGLAVERAVEAAGLSGSFAVMGGSHMRPMHALKLASFERVLILSDPDEAGDGVAARYEAALVRHAAVGRVRFPEGSDAQSVPLEVLVRLLTCGSPESSPIATRSRASRSSRRFVSKRGT